MGHLHSLGSHIAAAKLQDSWLQLTVLCQDVENKVEFPLQLLPGEGNGQIIICWGFDCDPRESLVWCSTLGALLHFCHGDPRLLNFAQCLLGHV